MTHLDLRPSWKAYRRWSGGGATLFLVVVAIGVVVTVRSWGEPHPVRTVVLSMGLVVLVAMPAFAHVAIMIGSSSLTLDPLQVVHRCYGRRTTLKLGSQLRGLLGPYITPNGNGGSQSVDLLILVGPEGRIKLNGGYWSYPDLDTVARATGATIDRIPRSAGEWERDLPGSMGFVARRPVATAFLIVGVLFVVIAGAIAAGVLLSR